MMSVEDSVLFSMDGLDRDILPFLTYIIQDLAEIGSDPAVICGLVAKHVKGLPGPRVLDLGCGKGAVSIALACRLSCRCLGIDAVSGFIEEARARAAGSGVDDRCRFETGDIRKIALESSAFDAVILGSIGPVLGDCRRTLEICGGLVSRDGIIIMDDGYAAPGAETVHPPVQTRESVLRQIRESGMILVDEHIASGSDIRANNEHMLGRIRARCEELAERHPNRSRVFREYVRNQEVQNAFLETALVCSTMVIKKDPGSGLRADK